MSYFISIIVPVYKAGAFVSSCVDSVLAQTFTNWELLLIDDGSPDESGRICDEYAQVDSRIKVFHKPNGGVSSARNLGLEYASGKWITFVDSDDIIQPMFLEYFENGVHDDVFQLSFFTDYITEHQGILTINHVGDAAFWNTDKIADFFQRYVDNPILKAVHSKFFLTELIRRNNLQFNHKVRAGEDHLFVLEYLNYIHAAKIINGTGYIYNLPHNYSLKYGQRIEEITYKLGLIEEKLQLIERNFGVDLSWSKKTKWHHGLTGVDIFSLYNEVTFRNFLYWYNAKVGEEYSSDADCNREARVASILCQIVGKKQYGKQFETLVSLLVSHIGHTDYKLNAFPRSTKFILYIASLRWKWLLHIFLFLAYGCHKHEA